MRALLAILFKMHKLLPSRQISDNIEPRRFQKRSLVLASEFPKPLKTSAGRNGWLVKVVDDCVLNLIGENDND